MFFELVVCGILKQPEEESCNLSGFFLINSQEASRSCPGLCREESLEGFLWFPGGIYAQRKKHIEVEDRLIRLRVFLKSYRNQPIC